MAIPSGARGDLPSQAEDAIISLFPGKVLDDDLATDSDGMNICEAALHVNLPLQSLRTKGLGFASWDRMVMRAR
jgi:hypothetical protein